MCLVFVSQVESHRMFEIVVVTLIVLSLGSLAVEGPTCQKAAIEAASSSLDLTVAETSSWEDANTSVRRALFLYA